MGIPGVWRAGALNAEDWRVDALVVGTDGSVALRLISTVDEADAAAGPQRRRVLTLRTAFQDAAIGFRLRPRDESRGASDAVPPPSPERGAGR